MVPSAGLNQWQIQGIRRHAVDRMHGALRAFRAADRVHGGLCACQGMMAAGTQHASAQGGALRLPRCDTAHVANASWAGVAARASERQLHVCLMCYGELLRVSFRTHAVS